MTQTLNAIDLEDLTDIEKCHLLALLATWQQQVLDEQPYELEDALTDSMFEVTAEILQMLPALQAMSHEAVSVFMLVLAGQIAEAPFTWNSQRFDFVHTSLVEDGVDQALSSTAAAIAATAHPAFPRTPQEQQILEEAWAEFRGYYLRPESLKPYLFG